MPKLFHKPCGPWAVLSGQCRSATSRFSEAARVAFVRGHLQTPNARPAPRAYLLLGDETIELPHNSNGATIYVGDVPKYGLMAMTSPDGQPVFFDGERIVTIDEPRFLLVKESNPVLLRPLSSWLIINDTVGKRAFIASKGLKGTKPFLYEIMEGPNLKSVKLDEKISGWMVVLSMPGDPTTWLLTRHGIFVEQGDSFRRIAHPADGDHIRGPAFLGLTTAGNIAVTTVNADREKKHYAIATERAECEFPISIEKDTMLPRT